ncbi:MAG: hypothetical protein ACREFW_01610 [Rhizomicrobium sp.]
MIEVTRVGCDAKFEFEVAVRQSGSETRHRVTMDKKTWDRLGEGRHAPEDCIKASFRFLLDREPKESILAGFDVALISRYFPEFERDLPNYFSRS